MSLEIDCMSAKKIIVPELAHCQITISTKIGNISLGSPSHDCVWDLPKSALMIVFRTPILPSNSSSAKNPTIDVLSTYGRNVIVRIYLWQGIFRYRRYAVKSWIGVMISRTQSR